MKAERRVPLFLPFPFHSLVLSLLSLFLFISRSHHFSLSHLFSALSVLKPSSDCSFSRAPSIAQGVFGLVFLAAAFSVFHINQQHVQRRAPPDVSPASSSPLHTLAQSTHFPIPSPARELLECDILFAYFLFHRTDEFRR